MDKPELSSISGLSFSSITEFSDIDPEFEEKYVKPTKEEVKLETMEKEREIARKVRLSRIRDLEKEKTYKTDPELAVEALGILKKCKSLFWVV